MWYIKFTVGIEKWKYIPTLKFAHDYSLQHYSLQPEWKQSQRPSTDNLWMDKQNVILPYTGIFFSNEKKGCMV